MRLDLWLWSVRAFPTRPSATDACRDGRVTMGERALKASRELRPGEEVEIHQGGFFRRLRHLADPPSRVGAKLVPDFCLDVTPEEEVKRRREQQEQLRLQRQPGEGRPTKRDRRALDRFIGKFIEDYQAGRL